MTPAPFKPEQQPLAANAANAATSTAWANRHYAEALIAGFAAAGIERAVISPGSRCTPLVLALLQQKAIACDVIIDERSAAFFALGLARASGRPPLLICTSGSAPAHYLPAVMEAHHSGVPLLIVSADRPREAIGWGANQAVEQRDLFAGFVRACHPLDPPAAPLPPRYLANLAARAVSESLGTRPGPVHLNQPFREPLWPTDEETPAAPPPAWPPADPGNGAGLCSSPPLPPPSPAQLAELLAVLTTHAGVIFCGQDGGTMPEINDHNDCGDCNTRSNAAALRAAVQQLASRLAAPLLADPLSGLRFGGAAHQAEAEAGIERGIEGEFAPPAISSHQEAWLRHPELSARHPTWVLRFGQAPVSRSVQRWLEGGSDTRYWVVCPRSAWSDPGHTGARQLAVDPLQLCTALLAALAAAAPAGSPGWQASALQLAWQQRLQQAEDAAAQVHRTLLRDAAASAHCWEAPLLDTLLDALPAGVTLFCGNSMAIRDLDSFSAGRTLPRSVHANRGVSGIDGQLSTAAGIASIASQVGPMSDAPPRPTLALIGDLACLHDLNALGLVARQSLIVVVINNAGGGIFEYLPEAAQPRAQFERGWVAPQTLQLEHAARAFGLPWSRVECLHDWQAVLQAALATGGPAFIEVVIDRARSVAAHRRYWAAVAAAVSTACRPCSL